MNTGGLFSDPHYIEFREKRQALVRGMNTRGFPVETVTWMEAREFCRKLSELPEEQKASREYRLPTEAQWEYACRGGAARSRTFHFGDSLSSTQANFDGKYPHGEGEKGPFLDRPTEVGSYPPNAFGLFDMHGNVNEWCEDWYDFDNSNMGKDPARPEIMQALRVIRGGSFGNDAATCRSGLRYRQRKDLADHNIGFRVCFRLD
jgi:formylglycine-generating enzyme required for sulfatase activity